MKKEETKAITNDRYCNVVLIWCPWEISELKSPDPTVIEIHVANKYHQKREIRSCLMIPAAKVNNKHEKTRLVIDYSCHFRHPWDSQECGHTLHLMFPRVFRTISHPWLAWKGKWVEDEEAEDIPDEDRELETTKGFVMSLFKSLWAMPEEEDAVDMHRWFNCWLLALILCWDDDIWSSLKSRNASEPFSGLLSEAEFSCLELLLFW